MPGLDMQIVRRSLFEGELLQIGHVVARPTSPDGGEIEQQTSNVLVMPLAGVFARHDSPRDHVIGTPNHAVFLAAGRPYRISFPATLGDECLTLRFSDDILPRVLPDSVSLCDARAALRIHGLLSPSLMFARNLLWSGLAHRRWQSLEIEEVGVGLLASVLRTVSGTKLAAPHRATAANLRRVEAIKEIVSLHPERRWTLGKLAELAGVSPYHLAHKFREDMGTTVHQYILRARLAKALGLVLDTDAGLTTIAIETGFTSHSHFAARFRALFGLTPSELRRRAKPGEIAELRKIVIAGPIGTA